jgi:hypothetical protein
MFFNHSRIAFLSLFIFLFQLSWAQIKPKKEDWFYYDLTHLQMLNGPAGLEQVWFSNGHDISLMAEWMPTRVFGVAIGLGYSSQNFHNNLKVATNAQTGEEVYTIMQSDTLFSVNHQNQKYLYLPLELRLRTIANSAGSFFRFYLGARVGVRLDGYSDFRDEQVSLRYYRTEDYARFRADAFARIGYRHFSLVAYYGLTPLIEGAQAITTENGVLISSDLDAIRPLAIGISMSF